jgi:hypothetical protein
METALRHQLQSLDLDTCHDLHVQPLEIMIIITRSPTSTLDHASPSTTHALPRCRLFVAENRPFLIEFPSNIESDSSQRPTPTGRTLTPTVPDARPPARPPLTAASAVAGAAESDKSLHAILVYHPSQVPSSSPQTLLIVLPSILISLYNISPIHSNPT